MKLIDQPILVGIALWIMSAGIWAIAPDNLEVNDQSPLKTRMSKKHEENVLMDLLRGKNNSDTLWLSRPTLIVLSLDTLETEQMRRTWGAEFYPMADDAVWYHAKVWEQMDSLHIPVIHSGNDSLIVAGPITQENIYKDQERLFTYYWFDGRKAIAKLVFQLLYNDIEGSVVFENL